MKPRKTKWLTQDHGPTSWQSWGQKVGLQTFRAEVHLALPFLQCSLAASSFYLTLDRVLTLPLPELDLSPTLSFLLRKMGRPKLALLSEF